MIRRWRRSYEHPREARGPFGSVTTGRSRRLADDGRHFTDPAVQFAGIFVGILNAAAVVTFCVAQHPLPAEPAGSAELAESGERSLAPEPEPPASEAGTSSAAAALADAQAQPPLTSTPEADDRGSTSVDREDELPLDLAPDLVPLLPAAREARDALTREGRAISRDALAALLRRNGHGIRNNRVSELLSALKKESEEGAEPAALSAPDNAAAPDPRGRRDEQDREALRRQPLAG